MKLARKSLIVVVVQNKPNLAMVQNLFEIFMMNQFRNVRKSILSCPYVYFLPVIQSRFLLISMILFYFSTKAKRDNSQSIERDFKINKMGEIMMGVDSRKWLISQYVHVL